MSRVWPYEYQDINERTLQVGPPTTGGAAEIRTESGYIVQVEVAELPGLVAALYAAAGLPEPVILERPEVPDGGTGVNSFTIWRGNADRSSVQVRLGNTSVALAPSVAWLLASVIAAYADEAEDEPDPAEVGELAAVVHEAGCCTGDDSREFDRDVARAALRWMKGRQP